MNTYTLEPQDLLFFRDGRPMEAAGGHGARWPEPSVIFDALHAALWRAFPAPQPWEHRHDYGRSSHRPRNGDTQRFGSLATAGLFPVWTDGRWLFPAPADATPSTDTATFLLRPLKRNPSNPSDSSHRSDLPAPLCYPVANFSPPTKEAVPPWWSAAAWRDYLAGQRPAATELFTSEDLFAGEWTTGIGIDPETQTQDGQRLYSAEYLRLRPDVRCGFIASLRMKRNGDPRDRRECIGELFTATQTIIVGGQQRACRVEAVKTPDRFPFPHGQPITGTRVKWVLLSPAIWPAIQADEVKRIPAHPGGWLPNWICPSSGQVLLRHRAGNLRRVWDETKRRTIRKGDVDESIAARLVAACVPKPVPVTGWTERLHLLQDERHWQQDGAAHGPRPAHLAVPAGAVYYFEAESPPAAAQLAAALNWRGAPANPSDPSNYTTLRNRRSTLLGEKGYGLGVCGTWQFYEPSV